MGILDNANVKKEISHTLNPPGRGQLQNPMTHENVKKIQDKCGHGKDPYHSFRRKLRKDIFK
jgi:hypothetical protein